MQTVDLKKTGEYVEDVVELHAALEAAKGETSRPSIVILKTIIGWPSPTKQNTGKIHGSALGGDELAATKKVLGLDPEKTFEVSDELIAHTRGLLERGVQVAGQRVGLQQELSADVLVERLEPLGAPAGWAGHGRSTVASGCECGPVGVGAP